MMFNYYFFILNFLNINICTKYRGIIKKELFELEREKFTIHCTDLENLIKDINREVDHLSRYTEETGKMIVLVAERFYFRIESNLAVTIIIDRINENQYQVVVIVAGGKHGLFEITWGAERSMLKKIKKIFVNHIEVF